MGTATRRRSAAVRKNDDSPTSVSTAAEMAGAAAHAPIVGKSRSATVSPKTTGTSAPMALRTAEASAAHGDQFGRRPNELVLEQCVPSDGGLEEEPHLRLREREHQMGSPQIHHASAKIASMIGAGVVATPGISGRPSLSSGPIPRRGVRRPATYGDRGSARHNAARVGVAMERVSAIVPVSACCAATSRTPILCTNRKRN